MVVAFNNNNANEDHSWGIKWEGNDTTLEYNYNTLKTLVNQKHWIPPAKLMDTNPAESIVEYGEQSRIEHICGAGFSALWKGMFPNAWVRTLAEAGIDNRMIIPASAKLRMAMMDGQREIWKIRNDLKFNKPIQPAEERRIEKAFRVLIHLRLNCFGDTLESIKKKTATQRVKWLKRQYARAGKQLAQMLEDEKKTRMRLRHMKQIREQNRQTELTINRNTSQSRLDKAFTPKQSRKRPPESSAPPIQQNANSRALTPLPGTAGPVRSNKSSEQLKPSPGKPSPTPSKQLEPTSLPTPLPPQWIRKRQRLRKVADTKAEKKSMKETTWHKTKKRYIAKVNQFAGENVVMDKKRKTTNTTEPAISKSKKKSRKQQPVPPQARQEKPLVPPPVEAQEMHARGHIPPLPD